VAAVKKIYKELNCEAGMCKTAHQSTDKPYISSMNQFEATYYFGFKTRN
jgi:hypothetical protein